MSDQIALDLRRFRNFKNEEIMRHDCSGAVLYERDITTLRVLVTAPEKTMKPKGVAYFIIPCGNPDN